MFGKFLRSEGGTATIEHVLWLPFTVGFLMVSADATMLFFRNQVMYDAVRDASRQIALGRKTNEDARDEMLARFDAELSYEGQVITNDGYVTSSLTVPFSSLTLFSGTFAGDATLSAHVTMWIESTVTP